MLRVKFHSKICLQSINPEGATMTETENKATTAEAQHEAAQVGDAKANATDSTKASVELSEDDLEAVAGGVRKSIR